MLRERMANRQNQPGWFSRHRTATIWIGIAATVIVLLAIFVPKGINWWQSRSVIFQELATVTMTSPTDSTVQELSEIRLMVSDEKLAGGVKVVVKGPTDKVKGSVDQMGKEIIWRPDKSVTEEGLYTVDAKGKGTERLMQDIQVKPKVEVTPPTTPTPPITPVPPTQPAPSQPSPSSERSKILNDLDNKYNH